MFPIHFCRKADVYIYPDNAAEPEALTSTCLASRRKNEKSFLQCAQITMRLLAVAFFNVLKPRQAGSPSFLLCSVPRPYKLDCPLAALQPQVPLHVPQLHLKYMHRFKK